MPDQSEKVSISLSNGFTIEPGPPERLPRSLALSHFMAIPPAWALFAADLASATLDADPWHAALTTAWGLAMTFILFASWIQISRGKGASILLPLAATISILITVSFGAVIALQLGSMVLGAMSGLLLVDAVYGLVSIGRVRRGLP